ncbi:MAG: undecaprenyl-phosphate glucose phosphotransferase [Thermodesulfobacteriota bacterium]|nr:MAG: undecaprenyl-phosphate glucose phosphotransferase [Thermodesulfobacteriota bacterium]
MAAVFRGADILIVGGGLWALTWLFIIPWSDFYTIATFAAMILFILASEISGLYGSWRFSYLRQEISQVFVTWFWVVFGLLILAYATKTSSIYSRRILLTWIFITPVLLSFLRITIRKILHKIRTRGRNTRTVAIIGAGEQAIQVAKELERLSWLGINIVGYFDDDFSDGSQPLSGNKIKVIGNTMDVVNRAKNNEFDIIFIALPMSYETTISSLVGQLSDTTAITYIVPDLFISGLLHTRWGYMGNIPFLSIHDRPFNDIDGWIKRAEDIILASLIMMCIAVPMLIIAILIKLTSKGPVIFKQKRYGLSGNEIRIWKFRTMHVNENDKDIKQVEKNDTRLTKLGKLLRKTSLDELPQFINVLQGKMSIVGPRPHAVAHNEQYRKEIFGYTLRHTIKPGITGWAQINGWRGETDTLDKMEKRVEHDLWYINNWSLLLDIKIIFLTIMYGFVGENAY